MTEPYFPVDGKTPSWLESDTNHLYAEVSELKAKLGFTGMACGWAMQPFPHGELTLSTKAGPNALRFSAPTPAAAVRMAHRFLSKAERETRP